MATGRYEESLNWIYSLRRSYAKRELRQINHLLGLMGDPHRKFQSVHVTGSNGKGSTAAMIASILRAAGLKVGVFTSPHLTSFTERIVADGLRIPEKDVLRLLDIIRPLATKMDEDPNLRHPVFFEIATAMAFRYFAEQGVEVAVVEAGLGGRFDATNVVTSSVSVITNVGLEHTKVLGDTLLEIAEAKAGIIKEGGVLVTATKDDEIYNVFEETCRRVGSKIYRVGNDIRFQRTHNSLRGQKFCLEALTHSFDELFIPLLGVHQLENAATAVGAAETLDHVGIEVDEEAIAEGLRSVEWPGRLELMQERPLVILDCAKDVEAARAVSEALRRDFSYGKLVAVVSFSSDKDIPAMMEQLSRATDLFVVTSHSVMGRAAEPTLIATEAERQGKPYVIIADPREAVRTALKAAGGDDAVFVGGSVFLVGEVRGLWKDT